MGCDIHAYIESQPYKETSPDYWWTNADLHIMRNYRMFGLLAGVRGSDAPLIEPRGWDSNSSTKFEYCLFVLDYDTDADGCCSKEDADKWVSAGYSEKIFDNMITGPDWHTASWLTANELEKVLMSYEDKYPEDKIDEWFGYVDFMMRIPNSRFIFWFDN